MYLKVDGMGNKIYLIVNVQNTAVATDHYWLLQWFDRPKYEFLIQYVLSFVEVVNSSFVKKILKYVCLQLHY